jgi:hypothetical protein
VKAEVIGAVVAQKEFTSSACSVCGLEVAVGMSFASKVFGVWHQWRLCKACCRAEGELAL